jgi:hypothetical protein
MLKYIVLIALCAINTTAMSQFKCDVGGKATYQDMPCADKGAAIKLTPGSGNAEAAATGEAVTKSKKMIADVNWRSKVQEAIAGGKPLVGMTHTELDQAMGAPSKVNAANYSGVLKDQIIYRQPSQTWYVYTVQGIVESIQNVPESNSSAAPKAPCLSPFTIREMETSASSITLSEAARAERLKQIDEAKKCSRQNS